jgi:hypothetical protein
MMPMYQSCQPWYPQTTTWSRPVKARAMRIAAVVASLPFLPKCTSSAHGTRSMICCDTTASMGCDSEMLTPSANCLVTAAVTSGTP